ncbi:MAG: hypothetical protein ACOCV8_03355 [Spirochaetota bacterium]
MYKTEYQNYIRKAKSEIDKKESSLMIDGTIEDFMENDKITSIWKKLMLRLANSDKFSEILRGRENQDYLINSLSNAFTQISDFRIQNKNCLLLRDKIEAIKAVCIGDTPIPLFSPNILNNYALHNSIDEKHILKPTVDTNFEPGIFQYNYEDIYMVNSSYVIVQNPNPLTGRYLTKEEIKELRDTLLKRKSVLIVDSSLGQLFPNLIYINEAPSIVEGVIYLINFSATGLSSDEINLVISNELVISKIREYISDSSTVDFKNSSPVIFRLLAEGIRSKELISFFNSWFKNETQSRLQLLRDNIIENISYSYPVFIHKIDGGNSLWLYFKDLPLGDIAISNLLKSQGLIVNPASFFYPEKLKKWKHSRECIHININGCIGKELEVVDILKNVISKCYSGKV